MLVLWTIFKFFVQISLAEALSPYFHVDMTRRTHQDSINFCRSIAMELVTIKSTEMNGMAIQFLQSQSISELVWMSLYCPSLSCSWPDGEALSPATAFWDPASSSEPLYECGVISDITNGYWRTRKCFDLYLSLCYAPPLPGLELVSGVYNFYDASVLCQSKGGQLAVLSNPVAVALAKDYLIGMQINSDIWIGLYGNGTHLTWQNMHSTLAFTDWKTGIIIPAQDADVAIVMDELTHTWIQRSKNDVIEHALCQHNYMVVDYATVYTSAKLGCEMYALDLAILSSDEVFTIAKNAIQSQISTNQDFWIGLTSDGSNFQWNNGQPLTFSSWVPNAPSGISTDQYVELDGSAGYNWNNRPATELNIYLCQYPTHNMQPITNDIEEPVMETSSASGAFQQRLFVKEPDVVPDTSPYFEDLTRSRLDCAKKCLEDGCSDFVFSDLFCSLYNSHNPNIVSIGSDTYA